MQFHYFLGFTLAGYLFSEDIGELKNVAKKSNEGSELVINDWFNFDYLNLEKR